MDEEMEDTVMFTFTAVEIDIDYEFDAARYFDFSREELLTEAREAELWFESVGSYPPSPFVTKLVLREDILLENVTTSPKTKGLENMALPDSDSDIGLGPESSAMDMIYREREGMNGGISVDLKSCILPKFNQSHCIPTGLTFYNHIIDSKAKRNTTVKPSVPRISTLMKPTASQLAKQNRPRQVGDSRFLKLENNEKSLNNSSALESQAAKRQKLEGGHLRKVADTNEQTHLVHKEPKRDAIIDGNSTRAKLRLTIPREPELETAHRAQRMRPKISREREHVTSTAPTFRALPMNRKEFHLKTSERALQHNTGFPTSSVRCNNSKVLHKPSAVYIVECSNKDPRRYGFHPS